MKPASAKAKGRRAENLFVDYLRRHGVPHAERRARTGAKDQGDITGWPGVCVEIKATQKITIPQWLRELDAEMVHAHAATGFVAYKPTGVVDPDGWYCILRPAVLLELMAAAGLIDREHQP